MTTVCSLNEIKSESKENLKMINPKNKTVLVMPKKNKIPPLGESNGNTIHLNNNNHMIDNQKPAKRPRLSSGSTKVKGLPPPVAVARRNARERNRVKQVNNGFAALREKIPEEVAEAFEAAGNGRGTSKKLSKVETLRMAVEYIRSLERLLEIEPSDTSDYHFSFANSDGSDKSIMSSSSPEPDSFMSNFDDDSIHQNSMSPLPDITTINGVQYYRIPGTNAYQPFNDPVLYENEENMQPLPGEMITIVEQQPDEFITNPLVDPTVNYKNTLIAPIRITIPSASSPSGYSGQSLSPALNEIKQENVYTSVDPSTEHQHQTISNVLEDNGSDGSEYYLQHTNLSPHVRYQGVVTLHPEHSVNDIVLQDTQLTAESMIEVMDWWDKHQAEQKQLPHFDGIKPQTRLLIGTQSKPEETC